MQPFYSKSFIQNHLFKTIYSKPFTQFIQNNIFKTIYSKPFIQNHFKYGKFRRLKFWKSRGYVQSAGARLNFIPAIYAENSYVASAWTIEKESVSSVQVEGKVLHPARETPGHLSK